MKLAVKFNTPATGVAAYQQAIPDSVATAGKAPESGGHYYGIDNTVTTKSGEPVWTPLYEPGKSYTLREARALHAAGGIAVPSVTTIFGTLAKPQLERWKMGQAAGAMFDALWDNPKNPLKRDERDEFIAKSLAIAGNASKGAMDLGTRIHEAIEQAVACISYAADLQPYVAAVVNQRHAMGITASHPEECVGSLKYGYAGRCDDYTDDMQVIDYKSRKSRGKKVPVYETDPIQLAAYGYAKFGNAFFKQGKGHIFAISTTEPGLLTVHTYTGPELVEAFQTFLAMTQVWRFTNDFDPRKATLATRADAMTATV